MNEKEYQECILDQIDNADKASASVEKEKMFEAFSLNNRLVCEPYRETKTLKASISGGIARPEQKTAIKGLKVLMDAYVKDNAGPVCKNIPKGSTAYIREEKLFNDKSSATALSSDAVDGPFILVDLSNVEFITPPKL